MIGTLNIKTRPLKLAYLVDPNNSEQIREAIRLSSSLWGGDYFPIIPLHKRMPATWREGPLQAPAAKDVILGYIEAFDPDILIQMSKEVPDFVKEIGLEIVRPEEIWKSLDEDKDLSPRYGLGIFEIINELFDLHFKYKPKYPVKIVLPTMPEKLGLFWSSWFGEIPEKLLPVLKKHYFDPLDIKVEKVDSSTLKSLLKGNVFFPRRITHHKIKSYGRSHFRDGYVYFMDANKIEDIVDFWNLRAVGKHVFPFPKQLKDDPVMRELLIDYLRSQRRHWPHNKTVCDTASIVRSRNSTMSEIQEYAKNLDIERPKDDPSQAGYFTLQHWYPRIWDEWGPDKDFVVPHELDTDLEDSIDISDLQDLRVRFRSLLPKFAQKFGYHGAPRCANEVSFRFYGTDEFIAEVFPKSSGKEFDRAISGLTSFQKDWRVGRNGLVKLVRDEFSETRDIPLAERLFFAWLKDLGWEAKQSAPGILAKQIHKKLEGHIGALRNETFLGLLEHMNGGLVKQNGSPVDNNRINQERELSVGEVKNRLADKSKSDLHEYLLSKGIFRLGIRAHCPHCTRNPWFSLEEIKDTMVCPKCLNTFQAIGNVDSATWCYKTAGPFSVPNYAEGAYAVLLTADFFDDHKLTAIRTTPALSFVAKANGKKDLEADMAAFWETTIYGEKQSGILFAECKTYGFFEKKDFDRMRYLGRSFPGAVLVFSTLRKQLTSKEIKELTRITKAGRKRWKTERPINPVLILTGTELLHFSGPPYCWDEATRKKFDSYRGLISLCDATQQIYLGLPSWQTEWQKRWEMQHQKGLAKKHATPNRQ